MKENPTCLEFLREFCIWLIMFVVIWGLVALFAYYLIQLMDIYTRWYQTVFPLF